MTAPSRPRSVQATSELRLLLRTRLHAAAGAPVAEVRITHHQRAGAQLYCVMALGTDRREVPLPKGAARDITGTLRTAFPRARWSRAQDYDVTTGALVEHVTRLPACLTGGAR
ncbi:hypothetical protein ACWGI0_00230 [Streptomyces sp. NPDC054802]